MWGLGLFEMGMLLCFGAAWPVSIYKSWTSRRNSGKSLGFLVVVFLGYISGILHKLTASFDYVIFFYILNAALVMTDILVYLRNRKFDDRMAESIQGGAASPKNYNL